MLLVGTASSICGENDKVATCTAPGVGVVRYVQVGVIVTGKTSCRLPCSSQLLDGLVEIRVSVEAASPEVFSVGWVVTTGIALFGTIVEDGNSSRKDDISKGVLEQSLVVLYVQPTLVVVIVEEGTESGWVRESVADGVHHVYKRLSGTGLLVKVVHGIVGRVVQKTRHKLGVLSKVSRVAIEHFADAVHASCSREAGPEVFLNVLDGVDSNAIEAVFLDKPRNPSVQQAADLRGLGVDVRETGNLALLDTALVAVVDIAGRVV